MSSYIVLARKYRPKTIDEVVGQIAPKKIIKNCFIMNRLPHAIIISGIRGVGKTTFARIIAQISNCIGRKNNDDKSFNCCECSNCISIIKGNNPDVLEIDAASYTGVQDIREIIENAHYLPLNSLYKIFIIDEVHMLSNSAFNALLKTLEEPLPHIKFILATTEIRKIPLTILSRCQKINLSRINNLDAINHYRNIVKKEGFDVEDGVLEYVSDISDGSLRDGLSILDQLMTVSIVNQSNDKNVICNSNIITIEITKKLLNIFDIKIPSKILIFLLTNKLSEALKLLYQYYYESSLELNYLLIMILDLIKNLSLFTQDPKLIKEELITDHFKKLHKLTNLTFLLKIWEISIKYLNDMNIFHEKISIIEIYFLEISRISVNETNINSNNNYLNNDEELTNLTKNNISNKNYCINKISENSEDDIKNEKKNLSKKINDKIDNTQKNQEKSNDIIKTIQDILEKIIKNNDIELYNIIYNDIIIDNIDLEKKIIFIKKNISSISLSNLNNRLNIILKDKWKICLSNAKEIQNINKEKKNEYNINNLISSEEDNHKESLLHHSLIKDIICEWSMKVDKIEL